MAINASLIGVFAVLRYFTLSAGERHVVQVRRRHVAGLAILLSGSSASETGFMADGAGLGGDIRKSTSETEIAFFICGP